MLFEYIEMLPSFHRRRDGMYLLKEPQLTLNIILSFKLSCAKFVFLSSEEVNKVYKASSKVKGSSKVFFTILLSHIFIFVCLFVLSGWLVGFGFGFCFLFPSSVPR